MYILQHKNGKFFKEQNLYLGSAILTDDIDSAMQMSLDRAEKNYRAMSEKEDWKIFQIVTGFKLGDESKRHVKAERIAALKKELSDIEGEMKGGG